MSSQCGDSRNHGEIHGRTNGTAELFVAVYKARVAALLSWLPASVEVTRPPTSSLCYNSYSTLAQKIADLNVLIDDTFRQRNNDAISSLHFTFHHSIHPKTVSYWKCQVEGVVLI